jgi:hypothetical protein
MEAQSFWQNFNLGIELSLSGNFLYNGLKSFDEMKTFYYEEDIFEFLYSISVGIERLQKTAIILKEDIAKDQQKKFEKSLISHNHLDLMKRITKTEKQDVSSLNFALLQLLGKFYKSWRYDRFSISDYKNYSKEKMAFIDFLEKYLEIEIKNEPFDCTSNNDRIKKFIGRNVGKIVDYLYSIIKREAFRLNLYTDEIRINTKAFKIFTLKQYNFINENIFWKELLVYILHNAEQNPLLKLYKNIKPLEFDEGMLVNLIKCLKDDLLKLEHINTIETLYEEVENKEERYSLLDLIGNESVYISDMDENDFE